MTIGGSGCVTSPAVSIVGGGGSNATAVSHISGGVPVPYATIQAAVAAAVSGDMVQVAAGTYNEVVNVTTPGIILSGLPGAIIQPDNTTALLDGGSRRPAVYINGVAGVKGSVRENVMFL